MNLADKNILVLGLGRSGEAAARVLHAMGARVLVNDSRKRSELEKTAAELERQNIKLILGEHPVSVLDGIDLIVLSPGIPLKHNLLKTAAEKGIKIWSEVELAWQIFSHNWISVTGTNGKTTTTSLIHEMFLRGHKNVFCGGNIGVPLSSGVFGLGSETTVVAEVSSFQLETIELFRPQVAVITNLSPDHLDRYDGFEDYADAKSRILLNQMAEDIKVINSDDAASACYLNTGKGRLFQFSRCNPVDQGAWYADGKIWYKDENMEAQEILNTRELLLRGPHNLENALAAVCAAFGGGCPLKGIQEALREFAGVEHRLENAGVIQGIGFINDSKATNVDSVKMALRSFETSIHLILGGRDKAGDFRQLSDLIRERVRRVYLLGEAAETIEEQLSGVCDMQRVESMEQAVEKSFEAANAGEWVVLSPACASFDMYKNYEHRGWVFKDAVALLKNRLEA